MYKLDYNSLYVIHTLVLLQALQLSLLKLSGLEMNLPRSVDRVYITSQQMRGLKQLPFFIYRPDVLCSKDRARKVTNKLLFFFNATLHLAAMYNCTTPISMFA